MSEMNFFRPPYEPPVQQAKPYSFIDDLLSGIHSVGQQAEQARQQREGMIMNLAQMRESASPEMWNTIQHLYGDRFPEEITMPHSSTLMQQSQHAAPLAPATPQQIQTGAAALGVQTVPQPPGFVGPPAPVPQPPGFVGPPAPVPLPPAPPVPQSLISAAGGQTMPSEANPFAALPSVMDRTRSAQEKLVNGTNPLQSAVVDRLTGKKPERTGSQDFDLLTSPTPMAGRKWASDQQMAMAKLDQALGKMDMAQVGQLLKGFGAFDKQTGTEEKILSDMQKNTTGEANSLQRPANARASAGTRVGIANDDRRLEGIALQLKTDEQELGRLQTADEKDKTLAWNAEMKAAKVKRKADIVVLQKRIQDHKKNLNQVTGNTP